MIVEVTKGIDHYKINLNELICSCGSSYLNEKVSNLSWMCPHIALAIKKNTSTLQSLHPKFNAYIPIINQHAQSNTDYDLPNIKHLYSFIDEVPITLFESCYDLDSRAHEFLRVCINDFVYTVFLPEMKWCINADMIDNPISETDKTKVELYIFENIQTKYYSQLKRIVLKNTDVLTSIKVNKSGIKFLGVSENHHDDFNVSTIIREPSIKIRLNLNIKGWELLKGSKVAYYSPVENKLEFNHRALSIFEKPLLEWCKMVSSNFNRIYNLEN
ncbi:hypothetical protein NQT72_05685 [Pseudoalteromonas carrageenovora]|uniref:hypothetical protein n=1 Tax=Pseudoalteromonas TaxID=53246 RepID=UPI0018CCD693|nr:MULTISPECIES: hypothetical protein [Pseudoalteromonas]MBH0080163.1 hypothetical protein [Pseudoalteromonas sp. NZS11]MCQ8888997.1 hypothetical protein [Pseudoalteromonas carrageenovora]